MTRSPSKLARPVVGITTNVEDREARLRQTYIDAVIRSGGVPILLAPPSSANDHEIRLLIEGWFELCDAFILSGGDDPATEPFGTPTHEHAKLIDSGRQRCETALLQYLAREHPESPVLGVCLGMQLMGLAEGATLNQHMPDDTPTHAEHWGDVPHRIIPDRDELPEGRRLAGTVTSNHRQALSGPGPFRVLARAPDGVIEAIDHPERRFWLGVQWHPERSEDGPLGLGLISQLIEACRQQSIDDLPR